MMLIQIAGHLGQDPETRFTPKGQKVTTLRIAVNVRRAKGEKTLWWRVTLWGETFDRLLTYLKKGSAVYVLGDMDIPETYQDREGNTQISNAMTASYIGFNPFGSGKSDRQGGENANDASDSEMAPSFAAPQRGAAKTQAQNPFADDDIPF